MRSATIFLVFLASTVLPAKAIAQGLNIVTDYLQTRSVRGLPRFGEIEYQIPQFRHTYSPQGNEEVILKRLEFKVADLRRDDTERPILEITPFLNTLLVKVTDLGWGARSNGFELSLHDLDLLSRSFSLPKHKMRLGDYINQQYIFLPLNPDAPRFDFVQEGLSTPADLAPPPLLKARDAEGNPIAKSFIFTEHRYWNTILDPKQFRGEDDIPQTLNLFEGPKRFSSVFGELSYGRNGDRYSLEIAFPSVIRHPSGYSGTSRLFGKRIQRIPLSRDDLLFVQYNQTRGVFEGGLTAWKIAFGDSIVTGAAPAAAGEYGISLDFRNRPLNKIIRVGIGGLKLKPEESFSILAEARFDKSCYARIEHRCIYKIKSPDGVGREYQSQWSSLKTDNISNFAHYITPRPYEMGWAETKKLVHAYLNAEPDGVEIAKSIVKERLSSDTQHFKYDTSRSSSYREFADALLLLSVTDNTDTTFVDGLKYVAQELRSRISAIPPQERDKTTNIEYPISDAFPFAKECSGWRLFELGFPLLCYYMPNDAADIALKAFSRSADSRGLRDCLSSALCIRDVRDALSSPKHADALKAIYKHYGSQYHSSTRYILATIASVDIQAQREGRELESGPVSPDMFFGLAYHYLLTHDEPSQLILECLDRSDADQAAHYIDILNYLGSLRRARKARRAYDKHVIAVGMKTIGDPESAVLSSSVLEYIREHQPPEAIDYVMELSKNRYNNELREKAAKLLSGE